MELKKSKKADLENKRGLFYEIGLVLSLLLMIGMFAWSQAEITVEIPDMGFLIIEEDIMEITRQEQKPPPQQKQAVNVVSDVMQIVRNDAKIETEFSFVDFSDDIVIPTPVEKKKEEVKKEDEPFLIVEDMPTFQGGGLEEFRKWVQTRLNYPPSAQENGIQGKVTLTFIIETDGTLTNIVVLQTPNRSLSDEAERILKQSPKWSPGKQRGVPARVKFTLPVQFQLN